MKKLIAFSTIWLLLAGCSDRELTNGNTDDVPAESNFLSVSIVASGTTGTRAANDEYKEGDGSYKDGTDAENAVKSVLFLFFDADGTPVNGIYNSQTETYVSYYLWNYSDEEQNGDLEFPDDENKRNETVEKVLNHVIQMRFPRRNDKIVRPTQIFTVVNPTDNYMTELVGQDLATLKDIVRDYETYNDESLSKEKSFVMTNSVYVDKENNVVYTTAIEDSNYQSTPELAAQNAVIIYVERILARIDLKIAIKNTNDKAPKQIGQGDDAYYIYYTGVDFPEGMIDGDDNGIYVKLLGWNVFDTPNMSRLIKRVDSSWDENVFGAGIPWSVFQYHRSFWAVNPPATTPGFQYKVGAFKEKDENNSGTEVSQWVADAKPIPNPGGYVTAYLQENAAPYESDATTADKTYGQDFENYANGAPVRPSKVILAAQLVDATGEPHQLAKYAGVYYSWENLKTVICAKLDLYYPSGTDKDEKNNTVTVYSRIKPEHLDYEPNANSNTVKIILSDAGKDIVWYKGSNKNDMTLFDGDVEDYINNDPEKGLGGNTVRVWSEGYTYFYLTIRHLGNEGHPGYYGVVRNHIYDATITSISGLGTPVSNVDDVLIPSPDEDTGILAAQVRILSWRLVSQSYDLNW